LLPSFGKPGEVFWMHLARAENCGSTLRAGMVVARAETQTMLTATATLVPSFIV
jgi:hypothetical protein